MDGASTKEAGASNPAELTAFVSGLLQQMQARFQVMSDSIVTKIDDMGGRIDDLERTIAELLEQAGGADVQQQQQSAKALSNGWQR